MTALERFLGASEEEARGGLLACCGSRRWAELVAGMRKDSAHDDRVEAAVMLGRPRWEALVEAGSRVWFGLGEADWLEAFACHPRIGERAPGADAFAAHSAGEQAEALGSLPAVAERLAEGNRAYEARFGFVYLVFASGRTAAELLGILERRLCNTRADELKEAALQQDRITRLRMERWLAV
jgi:OHCU decarboxylase